MATSLSHTLLSYRHDDIFRSQGCLSLPVSVQRTQFGHVKTVHVSNGRLTVPRILTKTNDALSSTIDELEKGKEVYQQTEIEQTEGRVAEVWRKIQGEDNWAGMLDPIEPILRSELIKYGEMVQVTYDAFDSDPFSKYCGSCRFPRRTLFETLGMTRHGYQISQYPYVTCNINLPNFFMKSRWPKVWSEKGNWMGYVAVSDDETSKRLGRRDIVIAWRGTVTRLEWIADMMSSLQPISTEQIPCPDPNVKVETGFLELYTDEDPTCQFCKFSVRKQILAEVKRLVEKYKNEELSISISGHSLGGALAVLSAYDIAETGANVKPDGGCVPVTVFSFSGPRVGNLQFKQRVESLGVKVLRVLNVHDIVPKSPGFFFMEDLPEWLLKLISPWNFIHIGEKLSLDHSHSPYLKETSDPASAHNLEAHLHLLDGYHGAGRKFDSSSGRDPALVNKSSDFLEDKYLVPPNWWQHENKGMVRDQTGRWVQPERPKLEDHPPESHHHLNKLSLNFNQK